MSKNTRPDVEAAFEDNCIIGRGDGSLGAFHAKEDGVLITRMVGYTIIPNEQYAAITAELTRLRAVVEAARDTYDAKHNARLCAALAHLDQREGEQS